jgi:predicted lipoprotein with Yx(FWY)xxD motif
MKRLIGVALSLSLLALVGAVGAQDVPAPLRVAKAGDLGMILTGPNGMTLYTFANDKEPGKSACNGGCATNWPPLSMKGGDPEPKAPLSVITRADGSKQYAYKGKPLYYWKDDKKAGDTTGHKVRDIWFVAQP